MTPQELATIFGLTTGLILFVLLLTIVYFSIVSLAIKTIRHLILTTRKDVQDIVESTQK